ncbi:PR domain zinc finger protein 5 isoform X2 [Bicyclus anynana]|uniref:PR domain zinc finger protein 5 isoform X2 n=1 Tax=Bicyclus anynana TaxID=110368 RepID=A0A6J1NQ86_BICAN|nr:PR domain zinc finger protein 5 isoform X2 [Bicyclus anynana]
MDIDEIEIKVEYNETYETDPLQTISQKNEKKEDQSENSNGFDDAVKELNLQSHNKDEIRTSWFQSKDSDGKLLCQYCNLKYSTVQTLRYHVKKKHTEEATKLLKIIINNKRNCRHICHICKKRFKDMFNLKCHMSEHSIELVKSSCMHCNATFNNTNELTEHIHLKHQKETKMTYMCKLCGYRTSKKSHYSQHRDTHKENKALICNFCDYKTNYSPNLKIHERTHTNDKPYLCDFKNCDYRSATKSALRSHQLKHYPNENMLFCDKCSYRTVYKQSLKKHLDSHKRNVVSRNANREVNN